LASVEASVSLIGFFAKPMGILAILILPSGEWWNSVWAKSALLCYLLGSNITCGLSR
jgi:hypothetical protein